MIKVYKNISKNNNMRPIVDMAMFNKLLLAKEFEIVEVNENIKELAYNKSDAFMGDVMIDQYYNVFAITYAGFREL